VRWVANALVDLGQVLGGVVAGGRVADQPDGAAGVLIVGLVVAVPFQRVEHVDD